MNFSNPITVLEIGCGLGDIILRTKSQKKIGIDSDKRVLQAAKTLGDKSNIWIIADLSSAAQSLKKNNLPPNLVQYLKSANRDLINEILKKDEYVDLVIPRGGKNLIRSVINNSSIPVLKHLDGVCHLYIDSYANESMAILSFA